MAHLAFLNSFFDFLNLYFAETLDFKKRFASRRMNGLPHSKLSPRAESRRRYGFVITATV